MSHEIRALRSTDELSASLQVFFTALLGQPFPPDEGEITDFIEVGRPLGAFVTGPAEESDQAPGRVRGVPAPEIFGTLVGTVSSYTSWICVPGGKRLPQAAVTDVGVLPTHARRGLGRALIQGQLEQIAGRGEVIATLRASEGRIYERFGYGVASSSAGVEIDVASCGFRPGAATAGGPVRFVDPKNSWDLLARIYEGIERPGAIDRHAYWWRVQAQMAQHTRDPAYIVVHGETGAEDGFVRYRPADTRAWIRSDVRTIIVTDLVAHTPAALVDLVRYLVSIDLVHRVVIKDLPVDHSLEKLLIDERAVRTTSLHDETWLRLIDVEAALAARSYAGHGAVTIEVTDSQLPENSGSYEVSAAGAKRTSEPVDLRVDVAALATLYLGGTKWWQLALGGRVVERQSGALAVAEELFATARAPFAGTMF